MILSGTTLYGFCSGVFGRDSYNNKIVVGTGAGWVVAKDVGTGVFVLAQGDDLTVLEQHTTPDQSE